MTNSGKATNRQRQYLVDEQGRRTGVVLSMDEYDELMEAAEQLEDIRHLQDARAEGGEPIPWEQVKAGLRAEGLLP